MKSRGKRLVYVFPGRFPTEKANGIQVASMAEAFAAAGYELDILTPGRSDQRAELRGRSPASVYGTEPSVRVLTAGTLSAPGRNRLPLLMDAGLRAFRQYAWARSVRDQIVGADLVVTRHVDVVRALPRRIPTILELHRLGRIERLFLRRADLSGITLVVALTATLAEDIKTIVGGDALPIIVEHDGVDPARFAVDVGAREVARRELGISDDAFVVAYMGSLVTLGLDKGVRALVRGVAQTVGAAGLLCVGPEGSAAQLVRDWAAEEGLERLWLPGWLEPKEIPGVLAAADAGAVPLPDTPQLANHSSPLKLFEFMASGTPIVASDVATIREVLRHEVNGLLIEPGNPREIAEAIDRLRSDPQLRERLAAAALSAVRATYAWDARASRILESLDRATAQRSPNLGLNPRGG